VADNRLAWRVPGLLLRGVELVLVVRRTLDLRVGQRPAKWVMECQGTKEGREVREVEANREDQMEVPAQTMFGTSMTGRAGGDLSFLNHVLSGH
jgi:hypothetical protein